jgi:hypothetical protein
MIFAGGRSGGADCLICGRLSMACFFAFPSEIRKVTYTTSAVESLPAPYNDQQAGFTNPPQDAILPHGRRFHFYVAHPVCTVSLVFGIWSAFQDTVGIAVRDWILRSRTEKTRNSARIHIRDQLILIVMPRRFHQFHRARMS